jgi:MFS family permease
MEEKIDYCSLRGPLPAFLAIISNRIGLGTFVPLLPFFVIEAGAPTIWLGIILTCQNAGVILGQLLIGYCSDRFGRKPALVTALLCMAFFFFLSGTAESVEMLALWQLFAGISNPGSACLGWVVDTVPAPRKQDALGSYSLCLMIGFLTGLVLGGVLGSLLSFFVACAAASGLAVLVVFVVIAAPSPAAVATASPGPAVAPRGAGGAANPEGALGLSAAIKLVACSRYWLSLALLQWSVGNLIAGFTALVGLVLIRRFGWGSIAVAGFYATHVVMAMSINLCCYSGWVRRYGPGKLCVYSTLASSVFLFVVWPVESFGNVWLFCGIAILSGLGMVVSSPAGVGCALWYCERRAPKVKATILGCTRGINEFGRACGPIIILSLYGDDGSFWGWGYIAIVELLSTIMFFFSHTDEMRRAALEDKLALENAMNPPTSTSASI